MQILQIIRQEPKQNITLLAFGLVLLVYLAHFFSLTPDLQYQQGGYIAIGVAIMTTTNYLLPKGAARKLIGLTVILCSLLMIVVAPILLVSSFHLTTPAILFVGGVVLLYAGTASVPVSEEIKNVIKEREAKSSKKGLHAHSLRTGEKKLTRELQVILAISEQYARDHSLIFSPELLLLNCLQEHPNAETGPYSARTLLEDIRIDIKFIITQLKSVVISNTDQEDNWGWVVAKLSYLQMKLCGDTEIGSQHLLLSILHSESTLLSDYLSHKQMVTHYTNKQLGFNNEGNAK